ncbi:MAG: hypothetical protein SCJ93_04440 [Bacillota bacterium]|nr:hypothetical protein [Bacillota bacterium]
MKVNLELTILEAKKLYESGIMDQLDKVVRGVNTTPKQGTKATVKTPVKKEDKSKEEPVPEPDPVKEEVKTDYTLEEVRAKFTELNSVKNRPKLKAILEKYGVGKVTELEEKVFVSVMEDLEKI